MLQKVRSFGRKAAVAAGAALGTVAAFAQSSGSTFTVDTSGITAAQSTLMTVGAAVFGVYVSIKLYKWARRAL